MHKETTMKEIDVVRTIAQSAELNALTMLCRDFYRCTCGMLATRTMAFVPVRLKAIIPHMPDLKVGDTFDCPTQYCGSYCDHRSCEVDSKTQVNLEQVEVIGPVKWGDLPHAKLARRFNALLLRESP
jgi:hypothetical protein